MLDPNKRQVRMGGKRGRNGLGAKQSTGSREVTGWRGGCARALKNICIAMFDFGRVSTEDGQGKDEEVIG